MYQVIDCKRGNSVDSEFDNFDDALARAEELAEDQADGEVEVSAYENGSINTVARSTKNWWEIRII